ncbi:elongation factor Ts [Candidatus Peregrinibacteria bacterium]|nr:elongation factor Ts [Candidatus Peregrinibacteria bacterium]
MITAAQVNELRKMTGSGMMDCKKALTEANGNMEDAVTLLRKKGAAKAASKSERETAEGAAFISTSNGKASLILLGCETDFVAKNEKFQALGKELSESILTSSADSVRAEGEAKVTELAGVIGENMKLIGAEMIEAPVVGTYVHSNEKIGVLVGLSAGNEEVAGDIAMHAAAMNPQVLSPEDISDELVAKEKDIWAEQLKNEGKPENIIENIMKGKEKKFRGEAALVSQSFVKDPSKTVEQYAKENGGEVSGFIRLAV